MASRVAFPALFSRAFALLSVSRLQRLLVKQTCPSSARSAAYAVWETMAEGSRGESLRHRVAHRSAEVRCAQHAVGSFKSNGSRRSPVRCFSSTRRGPILGLSLSPTFFDAARFIASSQFVGSGTNGFFADHPERWRSDGAPLTRSRPSRLGPHDPAPCTFPRIAKHTVRTRESLAWTNKNVCGANLARQTGACSEHVPFRLMWRNVPPTRDALCRRLRA